MIGSLEHVAETIAEGAADAVRAEPLLHSHVVDRLPDAHPHAHARVRCDRCESLLHLPSNSCMRTWIETGRGNFCVRCFILAAGGLTQDDPSQLGGVDCLPPSFGLPARPRPRQPGTSAIPRARGTEDRRRETAALRHGDAHRPGRPDRDRRAGAVGAARRGPGTHARVRRVPEGRFRPPTQRAAIVSRPDGRRRGLRLAGLALGLVLVVSSLVLIRAVAASPGLGLGLLLMGLAVLLAAADRRADE